MSWIEARKGWMKNYGGKRYAVSCNQLGCQPTPEASWRAANEWWLAKEKELHEGSPAFKLERILADTRQQVEQLDIEHHQSQYQLFQNWMQKEAKVLADKGKPVVPVKGVPPLVSVKVGEWLNLLRSRTLIAKKVKGRGGHLHIQRYDSYRREIQYWLAWLPSGATVADLTGNCWERWYTHLSGKLASQEWGSTYCGAHLGTARMFLSWLSEDEELDYALPKKVVSKNYQFPIVKRKPKPLPVETVQMLLTACTDQAQKTGLFILLAVQCGMYQSDISSLAVDEVNLKTGYITRSRSKTADGLTVLYKLWPETLALLKRYQATAKVQIVDTSGKPVFDDDGNPRYHFLLTEDNKPWIQEYLGKDDVHKKTDNVHSAWERLRKRIQLPKPVEFRCIRKTGANNLKGKYRAFAQYFLAHTPKEVIDTSYVVPEQPEFDEALAFLRTQILPAGWQPKFAEEAA